MSAVSSRFGRTTAAALAILAGALASCGTETPSVSPVDDATAVLCALVPVAADIPSRVHSAVDAARRSDLVAARQFAEDAGIAGDRIIDALKSGPGKLPTTDSRFVVNAYLTSLASLGTQISVYFSNEEPVNQATLALVQSELSLVDDEVRDLMAAVKAVGLPC